MDFGYIGDVGIAGNTATFSGWAASSASRPVSHRVFLGEAPLAIESVQDAILNPSDAVANAYPGLAGVGNCHWVIRATLPPGFDPKATNVFSYEAVYPGGPGRRFFLTLNPRVPLPSKELEDSIGGHFVSVAWEFLGFAYNLLEFKPHQSLLDVGCGIGRMAFALGPYLRGGSFEGFDIDPKMIEWAQKNITPHYPNCRFQVADVFNSYYNPRGRSTSGDYVFPFADATFDAATLTSVFTHMDDAGIDNYLAQLARVIKPGGRCLATAFLLDDETRAMMADGKALSQFTIPYGKFWTRDKARPENAVAIDGTLFIDMVGRHGFAVEKRFPGGWSGRKQVLTLQDLLILRR